MQDGNGAKAMPESIAAPNPGSLTSRKRKKTLVAIWGTTKIF